MEKKINIAIDGHSACGKSTTAKIIAQKLGYIYIDTGAMYRAVTYYFLEKFGTIPLDNPKLLEDTLQEIHISFMKQNEKVVVILNDKILHNEIRTPEVSQNVSPVSTLSFIRKFLVTQQQQIAKNKGVVMDGRDICTVVLPDAELKFFMTANSKIRAKRRQAELKESGVKLTLKEIEKNLLERDHIDSTRDDSPLILHPDAIQIDTSHMEIADQVNIILDYTEKVLGKFFSNKPKPSSKK
jgi:CMP/dCMP kinase